MAYVSVEGLVEQHHSLGRGPKLFSELMDPFLDKWVDFVRYDIVEWSLQRG